MPLPPKKSVDTEARTVSHSEKDAKSSSDADARKKKDVMSIRISKKIVKRKRIRRRLGLRSLRTKLI